MAEWNGFRRVAMLRDVDGETEATEKKAGLYRNTTANVRFLNHFFHCREDMPLLLVEQGSVVPGTKESVTGSQALNKRLASLDDTFRCGRWLPMARPRIRPREGNICLPHCKAI